VKIEVDVSPEVWQRFERISNDIGKDRAAVLTELINSAYEIATAPEMIANLAELNAKLEKSEAAAKTAAPAE
jgi:hypothetical protein